MLKTTMRWQVEKLLHSASASRTLALLALFPLTLLLPWKSFAMFDSSLQAVLIMNSLYALIIAATVGRDAGRRTPNTFWLFQKRVHLADYAAAEWVVVLVLGLVCVAYAELWHALSLAFLSRLDTTSIIVGFGVPFLLFAVMQTTLFLLNSAGAHKPTDVLIGLVFVASVADGILLRAPNQIRATVHFTLPPIQDSFRGVEALVNGVWPEFTRRFLHIAAYVLICLVVAQWLQRRRAPLFRPE